MSGSSSEQPSFAVQAVVEGVGSGSGVERVPPDPAQPTNQHSRRRRTATTNELKCTYCPKRFADAGQLVDHSALCIQSRAWECAVCCKRFRTRTGLQQHQRTHSTARPYQCAYCAHAFVQKSHLDQHERIHTGEKPFECQFCSRRFRQRSQQQSHEQSHLRSCSSTL